MHVNYRRAYRYIVGCPIVISNVPNLQHRIDGGAAEAPGGPISAGFVGVVGKVRAAAGAFVGGISVGRGEVRVVTMPGAGDADAASRTSAKT
jgi:hypothetical protein